MATRRQPAGTDVAPSALYARPFLHMAALLGLLAASRMALWAIYPEHFASLDAPEVLGAFVRGLRFDVSTAFWVLGLPVWLLLWPAGFARRRRWQTTLGWVTCALIVVMLFLTLSDLTYFSLVDRHIGHDFYVGLSGNLGAVLRNGLEYPLPWIVFFALAIAIVVGWRAWLRRPVPPLGNRGLAWALAIAWMPAFVIGARGGLQEMPIALVDAFRGQSVESGYLTLNGPFSIFYSSGSTRRMAGTRGPEQVREDERLALERFAGPSDETWRGDEYPLQRRRLPRPPDGSNGHAADPPKPDPHVAILVFEGLDTWVLDTYRRLAGLPELGATPNLDRLAREGILFTNLLGHGQLSIEGLGALLASFPSIPGLPMFEDGLEQTRMQYLGSAAKSEGYSTYFVRSAHRESFRLESFAALAGFDLYAGREDITEAIESHSDRPFGVWGAWDLDTLRFLHERIVETDGPFLALFFGSSSHPPYQLPGDEWRIFPGEDERSRYLNAVHYVDWALGEFMSLAEEAGYADETLWVITSDQASRLTDPRLSPDRFAVPTLIVGPGIPRDSVDSRLASQLDVMPTIIDAAGWTTPHASFGQSLLDERTPGALVKVGDLVLRADSSAWIVHSLVESVGGGGSPAARARLERLLEAEIGLLERLVRENRVLEGKN